MTLAHVTCNAFIESCFSIAGKLLGDYRLGSTNELLEVAVVNGVNGALARTASEDEEVEAMLDDE